MKQGVLLLAVPAAILAVVGAAAGSSGAPDTSPACLTPADEQVWIAGGTTRIGTANGYPEEGPAYEARVEGFWIDRHEVTNRQFAEFVAATGHITDAEREGASIVFDPPGPGEVPVGLAQWWSWVEGADWRHPEGPGSSLAARENLPVVHVSYNDALAYARWKGRALPSEEQFEYAARAGAAESLAQPPPRHANTWQGHFPIENTREDDYARLAPVGCYEPNAFGINDMIGNAWEWTQSWYLPGHAATPVGAIGNPSFDPAQPDARVRVIKGGSFLCAPSYCARYRPEARHAQDETSGASHLGFRTVSAG